MNVSSWSQRQIALYLTLAAAMTSLVSIAASQILLGGALAAALWARVPLRLPRLWIPLFLFVLLTLASAVASGQGAASLPQLKKFYVYTILVLLVSLAPPLAEIRRLILAMGILGALSALWSFVEFVQRYEAAQAAGRRFYEHYVGDRISGFMSHWMTFSGQEMGVVLLLLAMLLFSARRGQLRWAWLPLALCAAGLTLSFTRSMWMGGATGGLFLLWNYRKWTVALAPLAGVALLAANPFAIRERALSAFEPHGDLDSNRHREITRLAGMEMMKAHPLLGVGPEQVGPQFERYLPESVQRPLPPGYYGHLHNLYIHYGAERGIPAALAYLWFLGQMLLDFARGLRRGAEGESRMVLLGATAVLIAVLTSAWWEVNLGDSEVLTFFLAVMGCGYAALPPPEASRA